MKSIEQFSFAWIGPVGTIGNSPAIHRWESSFSNSWSPGGTTEANHVRWFQPSLRDLTDIRLLVPAINRWAIFICPSGAFILYIRLKSALWLLILASAFLLAPKLVSAQSFGFPVEHQHTFRNCRGTLTITLDKIEYKTTHKKDSRSWQYVDIRQIKVESPTALEIVTYEDQRRMLGRDRIFKFRLLEGHITPEVSAWLMAKATRPVVTSVLPVTGGSPTFEIPLKHLHTFGGCEGVLKIYPDWVTYESADEPTDSRYWRYADIQNFGHPTRYRFEITTFEDKFGGPTKVYNFQLKEDFPVLAYDYLWLRVYPTKYYPYEKTAPTPEAPPTPTNRRAAGQ